MFHSNGDHWYNFQLFPMMPPSVIKKWSAKLLINWAFPLDSTSILILLFEYFCLIYFGNVLEINSPLSQHSFRNFKFILWDYIYLIWNYLPNLHILISLSTSFAKSFNWKSLQWFCHSLWYDASFIDRFNSYGIILTATYQHRVRPY